MDWYIPSFFCLRCVLVANQNSMSNVTWTDFSLAVKFLGLKIFLEVVRPSPLMCAPGEKYRGTLLLFRAYLRFTLHKHFPIFMMWCFSKFNINHWASFSITDAPLKFLGIEYDVLVLLTILWCREVIHCLYVVVFKTLSQWILFSPCGQYMGIRLTGVVNLPYVWLTGLPYVCSVKTSYLLFALLKSLFLCKCFLLYQEGNSLFSLHKCHIRPLGRQQLCAVIITIRNILIF